MYKLVLCLRYLRTRYIMFTTIFCIALGVTAMIATNSVMSGFSHEMRDRIHGVLSDVTLEGRSANGFPDAEAHIAKIQELCGDKIESMTPICQSIGLLSFQIRGNWFSQQVCVIGIDPEGENETKDFGKFFQHPENRKQLSFDLRENGYEQSPDGSPVRDALQFAGWEFRRMAPPPLDVIRQPIQNDSDDSGGSGGSVDSVDSSDTVNPNSSDSSDSSASTARSAGSGISDDSNLVPLPELPDDPHADTPVLPDVSVPEGADYPSGSVYQSSGADQSEIRFPEGYQKKPKSGDQLPANQAGQRVYQVNYPPRQLQTVRIYGAVGQSADQSVSADPNVAGAPNYASVPDSVSIPAPAAPANPVYNNVFGDPDPNAPSPASVAPTSGTADSRTVSAPGDIPYDPNAPMPPQLDYANPSAPAISASDSAKGQPPVPAAAQPVAVPETGSSANPAAPVRSTPPASPVNLDKETAAETVTAAETGAAAETVTVAETEADASTLPVKDSAGSAIQDPFAAYRPQQVRVFDPRKEQHSGIILGISLACARKDGEDHFFLKPGCDVKLTMATSATPPTSITDNFTIVDLYESKMSEFDSSFVFVPLDAMQHLRGMFDPATNKGMINTIRIKLKNQEDGPLVRDILRDYFEGMYPGHYIIETWQDKRNNLLSAVEMEKTILNVLLFLIVGVSGFGILAIFFMIVVEKTRDIGILKALGASSTGIMAIFVFYGVVLGIVGAGLGLIGGILFSTHVNQIADWLARLTGRPVFDPDVYYFYKIPVCIDPVTVFWILFGAILIAVVASILPAWRAASMQPVEALR